jgi:hypothetical protein
VAELERFWREGDTDIDTDALHLALDEACSFEVPPWHQPDLTTDTRFLDELRLLIPEVQEALSDDELVEFGRNVCDYLANDRTSDLEELMESSGSTTVTAEYRQIASVAAGHYCPELDG